MKTLLFSTLLVIAASGVLAQEWSAEQKEVWNNVETYWDLLAKGDIDGFLTYFHDDFSGWQNAAPLPDKKSDRVKMIKFFSASSESLYHDIRPVAITVHDNMAIVHYFYTDVSSMDGEVEMMQGRWTDILVKDGDRWIMIGDHGGPDPVDD